MRNALRFQSLTKLADVVLIAAGVAAGITAYSVLFPDHFAVLTTEELAGGFLVSLFTFWLALRLWEGTGPPQEEEVPWLLFRQFCTGTGLSLVFQALLNYFQLLTRSFFLILVGGVCATLLLGIARLWIYRRAESSPAGVLMIGFDPIAAQLVHALGQRIVGVIGAPASSVPSEIRLLGEMSQLAEIVSERRPAHILVASLDWASSVSPSTLLQLRFRGVTLSHVSGAYERIFERVYCRGLYPAEMLLSPSLCVDSRTMAIQAIYTNLIGLSLLIAASPVLAAVTLAISLFSGPGPALESVECCGFQKIPFQLWRFRTLRTDGSGAVTGVGRIISRLRMVHLPQLINIVRGEVALIGPRPVRRQFAHRLSEMMPFYSIRFFVKPGIFGCGPTQLTLASDPECELRVIESDLYYIKRASPALDLEILIRALSGGKRSRELPFAESPGAAL